MKVQELSTALAAPNIALLVSQPVTPPVPTFLREYVVRRYQGTRRLKGTSVDVTINFVTNNSSIEITIDFTVARGFTRCTRYNTISMCTCPNRARYNTSSGTSIECTTIAQSTLLPTTLPLISPSTSLLPEPNEFHYQGSAIIAGPRTNPKIPGPFNIQSPQIN